MHKVFGVWKRDLYRHVILLAMTWDEHCQRAMAFALSGGAETNRKKQEKQPYNKKPRQWRGCKEFKPQNAPLQYKRADEVLRLMKISLP